MTDKEKLAKVRAEIERVKKNQEGVFTSYTDGKFDLCEHLLSFIDSMQEEPKDCMYSKDNYTDEDRKVLCDGCEEECEYSKKEEPVNDNFEVEVKKLWEEINTGHNYSIVDSYNQFYGLCVDIAEWQKEQMMAKAVKVNISNASIVSLPVNCDLKVGDKVLIIKEN